MLEDAIGDATTAEARARLVARFEAALAELTKAREAAAQPGPDAAPAITPDLLARLEVFRDPVMAWARFTRRTRAAGAGSSAMERTPLYSLRRRATRLNEQLGQGLHR